LDASKRAEQLAKNQPTPKEQTPDPAAWKQQSKDNLIRLGKAMHEYHDVFKRFPNQRGLGPNKSADLSWRVALLPFLGHEKLYMQFNHSEPWDSPHNKKVLEDNPMPDVFKSPLAAAGEKKTYYQIFFGDKAIWRPASLPRTTSITDGTSYTILIVEAKEPVYWTGPGDISFNGKDVPPLGGIFNGDFNAVMADGKAYFFQRSNYRDESIVGLITAVGGENILEDLPKD
jgi:hypothetical protein